MTYAAVHHVIPLATIVRERRLPVKGTVRVRSGQRVSPGDVVAEASWARDHVFLDVARTLGITTSAADALIRFKAGDNVPIGAVIARGGGLLPKTVTSPRAGRVVAAGGGEVLIEFGESRLELRAGLSGTVQGRASRSRRRDPNHGRARTGSVGKQPHRHRRDDQPGRQTRDRAHTGALGRQHAWLDSGRRKPAGRQRAEDCGRDTQYAVC